MEDYQPLVKEAIEWAKAKGGDKCEIVGNAMDRLFVVFAKEILKLIPGRVSVEVDASPHHCSRNWTGDSEELKVVLKKSKASDASVDRITVSEAAYRWALNEDPMSSDKLSEGIRFFARDARLLEEVIRSTFEPLPTKSIGSPISIPSCLRGKRAYLRGFGAKGLRGKRFHA
ncbi:unnamed protein product, partial [Mesorhabditis spiculigera]